MRYYCLFILRLLFCSIFLTIFTNHVYADEYIGEEIYEETHNSQFNFKKIIKDPVLFEKFIRNNLKTVKFKDSKEVQTLILKSTKDLSINTWLKKEIFISEFLYRLSNSKKAIPKLLSIFVQRKKLILFSLFIIGTFILSMLLAEIKFSFKVLSKKRIFFSVARIFSINLLRLWGLFYFFGFHLAPVFNVYINTVASTKESYPLLYKVTFLVSMLI